LARDYYVIFEDFDGTTNQGLVMVIINPLVEWIWIGGALLLIGGLVSFSAATRKVTAPEDKD
jgi:cytochrome c-type biogenesis protein CcmF